MNQGQNSPDQVKKLKMMIAALIFGGLFWLGYHYIESINPVPSETPPSKPAPVIEPIVKDYRPEDPLLEIKMTRDRERSREIEQIQGMLEKQNLSAEVRSQAEKELWRLTQALVKESELESLLKANGFKNTLTTISPNLVTVVIAEPVSAQQVKQVGQMAAEVTSYRLDQVQIVKGDK